MKLLCFYYYNLFSCQERIWRFHFSSRKWIWCFHVDNWNIFWTSLWEQKSKYVFVNVHSIDPIFNFMKSDAFMVTKTKTFPFLKSFFSSSINGIGKYLTANWQKFCFWNHGVSNSVKNRYLEKHKAKLFLVGSHKFGDITDKSKALSKMVVQVVLCQLFH